MFLVLFASCDETLVVICNIHGSELVNLEDNTNAIKNARNTLKTVCQPSKLHHHCVTRVHVITAEFTPLIERAYPDSKHIWATCENNLSYLA